MQAHPRSRGEHKTVTRRHDQRAGSPPLARGTPSPYRPHGSGVFGSPPLARGTLRADTQQPFICRLTPARAGNTALRQCKLRKHTAHPRSRGEHELGPEAAAGTGGSPPLARGTLLLTRRSRQRRRLTPARAGNTLPSSLLPVPLAAHPRSRGEHVNLMNLTHGKCGSPPLARGTLIAYWVSTFLLRLTPARAGNTTYRVIRIITPPAHPRSRGEHLMLFRRRSAGCGSPPLARGTPCNYARNRGIFRLTPARAGNTKPVRWICDTCAAHPRSRGEHFCKLEPPPLLLGSPPLARGTHLLTWGFTPYISKIESLWSQSLHPEYTINNRS